MKKVKFFTLIELLVVIAIIAVLAAMLLPALNKARERAKIIKCVSNLKQMGIFMHLYADNSDGFFPVQYYKTESPWLKWSEQLRNGTGEKFSDKALQCPGDVVLFDKISYGFGYHWGRWDSAGAVYGGHVKINQVVMPTYLVQLIDAKSWVFSPHKSTWEDHLPMERHNGVFNMLFTDGHAQSKKARTFGLYAGPSLGWPRDDYRWKNVAVNPTNGSKYE